MKRFWTITIIGINSILLTLLIVGVVGAERLDAIWVAVFSSDSSQVEVVSEKKVVQRRVVSPPVIPESFVGHEEDQSFLGWIKSMILFWGT